MPEKMEKLSKMLDKELEGWIDKIERSGSLSPDDLCVLKDGFKLRKLLKEGEEENSYERGYSTRRGRSRMTGRYVSRDDGSYGSYEGSNRSYRGSYHGSPIVEKLERMLNETQDEREQQMIEEWLEKAERM